MKSLRSMLVGFKWFMQLSTLLLYSLRSRDANEHLQRILAYKDD
jgi:hypothetical protein